MYSPGTPSSSRAGCTPRCPTGPGTAAAGSPRSVAVSRNASGDTGDLRLRTINRNASGDLCLRTINRPLCLDRVLPGLRRVWRGAPAGGHLLHHRLLLHGAQDRTLRGDGSPGRFIYDVAMSSFRHLLAYPLILNAKN